MCYAIPGKVIELQKDIAVVDYFGEHRNVINEYIEVQVGDYIYAQGGMIIEKIEEKDALPILKIWKQRLVQLQDIDRKIAQTEIRPGNSSFDNIIKKVQQGKTLTEKEALQLLQTKNTKELDMLYKTANKIRQQHLKNTCCVHGIIEFSNYCRNNCLYCGIRRDNKELPRYRMSVDEIVALAKYAVKKLKFKALVLQSGEDLAYTTEDLVNIVAKIKESCGVLLFMSVGSRDIECYKRIYTAGARGVLMRFETSNPALYKKMHDGPKADQQKRMQLLREIRNIGYLVVTGSLIGLPAQTEEDILRDITTATALDAEMYSFGPLLPNPGTPLADLQKPDIHTVLKTIAVTRILNPTAKIVVTTALETLDKDEGAQKGLLAGANSLMINVMPQKYKQLYALYPERKGKNQEVIAEIREKLKLLYNLGRAPTDLGI